MGFENKLELSTKARTDQLRPGHECEQTRPLSPDEIERFFPKGLPSGIIPKIITVPQLESADSVSQEVGLRKKKVRSHLSDGNLTGKRSSGQPPSAWRDF